MKPPSVLQIGFTDTEGARFNGHELHREMVRRGINSHYMVWRKKSDDPHTTAIDSRLNVASQHFLAHLESLYSLQALLYPYSFQFVLDKRFLAAQVVHYHLVHTGFFNLTSFPLLSKLRPAVWTLHDPWAMTGHCVHPLDCDRWRIGCGNCPNLQTSLPMRTDKTAMMWSIKKRVYEMSDLDIVVASRWMYRMATESPLLSRCRIHHVPFGIDLKNFRPAHNQAELKQDLGIPPENFVFLYRALPGEHKGLEYVVEAFERLAASEYGCDKGQPPITILLVNQKGHFDKFLQRYHVMELGWIDDPRKFARVIQACDVFLMPSTGESFGMMAIEAMACEKPVIVFEGTALPEVTFAPKGAMAVPSRDAGALMSAMREMMGNGNLRKSLGRRAHQIAHEHYDFDSHVTRMLELYGEVLARRSGRGATLSRVSSNKS